MAHEFISYCKKSKDFRYSHLKVPSQKASSKKVKCCSHTDGFSLSKNELGPTPKNTVANDTQAELVCLLLNSGRAKVMCSFTDYTLLTNLILNISV